MTHPLRSRIALPLLVLAVPLAARAQDTPTDAVDLGTIVVRAEDEQASPSATTFDKDKLETEYQGAGLDTILRGMAGVTTQGGKAEGGEISVNIRGMQEFGRVAVTIDGMRQNFARSGHSANGSFAVDPEMLREVTVTRGPGAKSGAIGGALELRRVAAEDLLPEDGGDSGGEFRLRYGSDLATPTVHGAYATRLGEAFDLTVAGTRSEDDDYTAPDGTKVISRNLIRSGLATLGYNTANGQRLTFTASQLSEDYITGSYSGFPRDTDLRQHSFSLGYEAKDILGGWDVNGTLYDTRTRLWQERLDDDLNGTGITRSYRTRTLGLLLEAERDFLLGNRTHDIALRLEAFRDTARTLDDSGSLTPSGNRDVWSLTAEDTVSFGALAVTFGLTADSYGLDSDDGTASGDKVSPSIALEYPLGAGFTVNASAAMAYRPPSLNETLVSGMHPEPADFPIIPNPDLVPERARTIELGVSYARDGLLVPGDSLSLRAAIYQSNVDDYIDLESLGTVFNSYYQYNNVDHVRIKGLELEGTYDTGRFFGSLAGQITESEDLSDGSELTKVAPDRLVLTAGMRSADRRRQGGARLTFVSAKEGGDEPSKGWQTMDLFLTQQVSDRASVSLALNNIFDETYTPHLETRPYPGFNALASLTLRF